MTDADRLNIIALLCYCIALLAFVASYFFFIYDKTIWLIPSAFLTIIALVISRIAIYYKQFFDQDSN